MCEWGERRTVTIERQLSVDACIADQIVALNRAGVYTVNSCCGHGREPGSVSILPTCQRRARELGYMVEPPVGGNYPCIALPLSHEPAGHEVQP